MLSVTVILSPELSFGKIPLTEVVAEGLVGVDGEEVFVVGHRKGTDV